MRAMMVETTIRKPNENFKRMNLQFTIDDSRLTIPK
jgi:hypothetical protein